MSRYTKNIEKLRISDERNFDMTDNEDQSDMAWAMDDDYDSGTTDRHSTLFSEPNGDSGVLASSMSDTMSQGYLNLEQRKGSDSANYSQYYLREWETEPSSRRNMRNEYLAEEPESEHHTILKNVLRGLLAKNDGSPAPPEAFEIGKDFVDGSFEVETNLASALDNMFINRLIAPELPMPIPHHPDDNYYLFDFSQSEERGDYMREDSFPFQEVETTYSP